MFFTDLVKEMGNENAKYIKNIKFPIPKNKINKNGFHFPEIPNNKSVINTTTSQTIEYGYVISITSYQRKKASAMLKAIINKEKLKKT